MKKKCSLIDLSAARDTALLVINNLAFGFIRGAHGLRLRVLDLNVPHYIAYFYFDSGSEQFSCVHMDFVNNKRKSEMLDLVERNSDLLLRGLQRLQQ